MTTAKVRSVLTRGAFVVLAVSAVAACGGTTETAPPAKDVVPASIIRLSTDTIRGPVGSAANIPLTVTVKNAAGDALDTTLVTFAVGTGSGSVANPSVRTNASGQAVTTWTLGSKIGLQTVTATVGTLAPVVFAAVATAGPASALTKVAGDAQTALVGTNVAVAPSVKVADSFGNPLAGQLVTFSVSGGGGSVTGPAVNTGADGVATVGSWKVGGAVGANTLVASTGTLSATFTATAGVGAAATVRLTPAVPGELFVAQTVQLSAVVSDASANVIANPVITYTTSGANIASVSASGLITANGAGTATITATSGAASASVAVTVIGHPTGTTISNTVQLGAFPGDVAYTNSAMLFAISGLQKVAIFDATGTTQTGLVTLSTPVPILLATTRAAGPAVAINIGTTSRLWYIDPTTAAVTDSVDVNDFIQSAAMTSDGKRVFTMLSNGQLAVFDGTTHGQITRITLGGGVNKMRIAPGDTLLYALTTVGVIFEVDIRNNVVKRQIIASVVATDFDIGRDGLFYLLDGLGSVVRIVDVVNNPGVPLRTVGVSGSATTIAVTPDTKQIWLTHTNPAQVSIYTGNLANGFLSSGTFQTAGSVPIRIYFSPNGSVAAVTNFGGWVDIVR